MSKNELRVIARIMLIGVGLYVLIQTFFNILSTLTAIPWIKTSEIKDMSIILIPPGICTIMAIVILYFLVRCANRFSDKIVGSEPVEDTQISGIAVAFRLVCLLAGVMFIYWSIPSLIVTVYTYVANMNTADSSGMRTIYTGMSSISEIVKYIILLGLGVYLAYGAPHFVRWQVRRTLKQCGKIEEQKPTWD